MNPHEHSEGSGAPNIPVAAGFELVPIERLKQYPFLEKLSETVLKKLQPNLVEKRYEPGDVILRMGDYSDAAYYLREGLVQVRLQPAADPTRRRSSATATVEAGREHTLWGRVQKILKRP